MRGGTKGRNRKAGEGEESVRGGNGEGKIMEPEKERKESVMEMGCGEERARKPGKREKEKVKKRGRRVEEKGGRKSG